ncbi:pilus assembly PilX family protein [Cellvibrio sp. UBA7671]|jgi:type IV pilus assembly protein PilX
MMRSKRFYHNYSPMPVKQAGVVLIVGLVMVLLITIVSLSAIRGTGLQENMAGNMRDRNIAFQATESALREGESIVGPNNKTLDPFECVQESGLCQDLSINPQNSVLYMADAAWKLSAKESLLVIEEVASKPSYLIEELQVDMGASAAAEGSAIDVAGMMTTGDAVPYRVTAKGVGLSQDTRVVLQSAYKRRFK